MSAPVTSAAARRRVGLRGWSIWALGALFFAFAWFQRVAPSVMIDELMGDFAVGAGLLGTLSAIYFYAYAGLQIPVGVMVDRWGPRRLLTVAAASSGLGALAFAGSGGLLAAYGGRLLVGAGAGLGFVSCLKLVQTRFPPERFAQVSGLTVLVGMLGGIGGQAPLATLVAAVGWRPAMAGSGAFALALAVLIWLFVRDVPAGTTAGEGAAPPRLLDGLRLVIRRRETWLVTFAGLFLIGPVLAVAGLWGVPYLMAAYGVGRPEAAAANSLMLIGLGLGGPITGFVSDRWGRRRPVLVGGALTALLAFLGILYLPGLPVPVLYGLFFVAGLGAGTTVVLYALAGEVNPPEAGGVAYGMVNTGVMAGGAITQPLVGVLLDTLGPAGPVEAAAYPPEIFRLAFAVLPVSIAISALLVLMVGRTRTRRPVVPREPG